MGTFGSQMSERIHVCLFGSGELCGLGLRACTAFGFRLRIHGA